MSSNVPPASPRKRLERRTPLRQKSELKRTTRLRAIFKNATRTENGRDEWKQQHQGFCQVCQRFEYRLHHHHVYPESKVRQAGGDPWDLANGMLICEGCHSKHHNAFRKIPACRIPPAATAFLVALIGAAHADLFIQRYYGHPRGEEWL